MLFSQSRIIASRSSLPFCECGNSEYKHRRISEVSTDRTIYNFPFACFNILLNIAGFIIIIRYKMSEDAVVDWESIIHKNVRSKDGQDAGNVDAIEGSTVVITSEGDRKEYNLPKSQVAGYDGAEVSLKITFGELEKYKV